MFNPLVIVNKGYISSTYRYEGNIDNYYSYMPYLAMPASTSKVRSIEIPDITFKKVPEWTSTEKPPENYGEDSCNTGTKMLKVIDFYVDGVSIEDMTMEIFTAGEGTEANPFRCISYALYIMRCVFNNVISAMCDVYMVLHVRGKLNYFDQDIVKKLPETKNTFIFTALSDYDRFYRYLIYDFDECEVLVSIDSTYNYNYGIFSPSFNCFLCKNMCGTLYVNAKNSIFKCGMIYKCFLEIYQNYHLDFGGDGYHSNPTIYESNIGFLCEHELEVFVYLNSHIVNTKIKSESELHISYPGAMFSGEVFAYRSNFEVVGVLSLVGAYDCVIQHTTNSTTNYYGEIFYSVITITDDSEEIAADRNSFEVRDAINSKISATNCKVYIGNVNGVEFEDSIKDNTRRGTLISIGDTANSTFKLNTIIPRDYDGSLWPDRIFFGTSDSVHVNSHFNIDATWTGSNKNYAITMYGLYNTDLLSTLHNCTLTCTYSLPSEYYYFNGYGLYYKSSFNISGGSIWEGVCITGPGEKEYIAKCKQDCIGSGHDDCDERCKSYCEQHGDR